MRVVQLFKLFALSSLLIIYGFDEADGHLFDFVTCPFVECCESPWLLKNTTGFKRELELNLYGQHLVVDTVTRHLSAHLKKDDPDKALVLSFHGGTGSGKSFVSRLIAKHLFKEGLSSQYVTRYVATLHFPHETRLEIYKNELREAIKATVYRCPTSLFIFDEMDKLPAGLIETIQPFIDHHKDLDGVNYGKSIFLFLSNTAGNAINERAFQYWESGYKREDIDIKDLENSITNSAIIEDDGLWHSSLIEKHLITAFVPFLPMERRHIKLCAGDVLRTKDVPVTEKLLDKVADELHYFPAETKLYSTSGCKRVSDKVNFVLED